MLVRFLIICSVIERAILFLLFFQIGDEVLELGGNAVDAAVASTFCMALMEPHITGLVISLNTFCCLKD